MSSFVAVLKGKDAKKFEEYMNRPATIEELKFVRDCDDIYNKHRLPGDKETPEEKKERIANRRELDMQIKKLRKESG